MVDTIRTLQEAHKEWVDRLLDTPRGRRGSDAYTKRDGLVYKADALCVPEDEALRAELMRMHHDDPLAGHFAANKTLNLICRKYWWLGILKDMKEYTSIYGVYRQYLGLDTAPYSLFP